MRRADPSRANDLPAPRSLSLPAQLPGCDKVVYLKPGELFFGDSRNRIRTLLGSCVSVTVWHERLRMGGMCHYMLPKRPGQRTGPLDGRYGDEAMELLLGEARRVGASPAQCQVKLFGGGRMLGVDGPRPDVAERNVDAAHQLAEQHGLRVVTEHLGGSGHRHVVLDVMNGDVWLRHESLGPR